MFLTVPVAKDVVDGMPQKAIALYGHETVWCPYKAAQ